jgi:hypothetical protein
VRHAATALTVMVVVGAGVGRVLVMSVLALLGVERGVALDVSHGVGAGVVRGCGNKTGGPIFEGGEEEGRNDEYNRRLSCMKLAVGYIHLPQNAQS